MRNRILPDEGAAASELAEAGPIRTIFPNPTLSEMMHESVLDAYGRALHY